MKVEMLDYSNAWKGVLTCARCTVHKEATDKEPSHTWKKAILRAEHSPIRRLSFTFKISDLPYWVSVHLVRHKIGIEHYVSTQRSDRTGIQRDNLPQGALVDHVIQVNAQAMISVSRKRLCKKASPETQEVWRKILEVLKVEEPEIFEACVPECVYRNGLCPEIKTCGWIKTEDGQATLRNYLEC